MTRSYCAVYSACMVDFEDRTMPTPATPTTGHFTRPAPLENTYASDSALRRILECMIPFPFLLIYHIDHKEEQGIFQNSISQSSRPNLHKSATKRSLTRSKSGALMQSGTSLMQRDITCGVSSMMLIGLLRARDGRDLRDGVLRMGLSLKTLSK